MFSLVYTHRAHLTELIEMLKLWSQHGHIITCIWDGAAPKEKQEIIGQRRSARESAMTTKQELETYLEQYSSQLNDNDIKNLKTAIGSLSWQGWHLSGSLKKEIQDTLGPNVQHIFATGEADDVLIEMSTKKIIDIIISLDSDLFAMGGERIWRVLKIRKEWIIEDIFVENVCNKLNISLASLQDACFLAGWDRCHLTGVSYMPFDVSLNRIQHYGTVSNVIQKFIPIETFDKEAYERLKVIKRESKERWTQVIKERSQKSIKN